MTKKKSQKSLLDFEPVPFRTDYSFFEKAQKLPTHEELAIIASTLQLFIKQEEQFKRQSSWGQDAIVRNLRK